MDRFLDFVTAHGFAVLGLALALVAAGFLLLAKRRHGI